MRRYWRRKPSFNHNDNSSVIAMSDWRVLAIDPPLHRRKGILRRLLGWPACAWNDLISPRGYRGIAVVIAAYVGVYSIMEASHERQMSLAGFERNMFITMVESGNRGSFVAAMRTFGPIQTMSVFVEPSLLEFWKWWDKERPNLHPLFIWAQDRLKLCKPDECGALGYFRLELSKSDLRESMLEGVDLSGSDLTAAKLQKAKLAGANLMRAHLIGADMQEAILRGAYLQDAHLVNADLNKAELVYAALWNAKLMRAELRETDLRWASLNEADFSRANLAGANLTGTTLAHAKLGDADLSRADLREAKGLVCDQLTSARNWHLAYRDAELACGADIPHLRRVSGRHRFAVNTMQVPRMSAEAAR